jgi:hypothetical protein
MELLDHIASEIEQAMDDKNYNLKMLYKQRSQIGKGSYILYLFWMGGKSVPKIIQKSLQMIKRIF